MLAGFARRLMTPAMGVRMMGFGTRDVAHGCQSVHDELYCRALYLSHEGEQALIVTFDMCFIGKREALRCKGALGTTMGLEARQILLNASHSHAGPATGRWYAGDVLPDDHAFLDELHATVLAVAQQARQEARPVSVEATMSRSALPRSRRRVNPDGRAINAPNPAGLVCDALPVIRLIDSNSRTVCLLFSASAHPSSQGQWALSAEYPGVAMAELDGHLGSPVSMFLQGCAGDAKMSVCDQGGNCFRQDHWPDIESAGRMLAGEVRQALDRGMTPVTPWIQSAILETRWPLSPAPSREHFQQMAVALAEKDRVKAYWARQQVSQLDRTGSLPADWPVTMQGIQLGEDLRLVSLEGEPVAAFGHAILNHFPAGITMPLGYSNGEGLYLVTTEMLAQGGMEPTSYWEYGLPSPLAPGTEQILQTAMAALSRAGIS